MLQGRIMASSNQAVWKCFAATIEIYFRFTNRAGSPMPDNRKYARIPMFLRHGSQLSI